VWVRWRHLRLAISTQHAPRQHLLPYRIADAILTVVDDMEWGIWAIDAAEDGAIDIDALEDDFDPPASTTVDI